MRGNRIIDLFLYNFPLIEIVLLFTFTMVYLNDQILNYVYVYLFIICVILFLLITIAVIHIFDSGKIYKYTVLKVYAFIKVILFSILIYIMHAADIMTYITTLDLFNKTVFISYLWFIAIGNILFLLISFNVEKRNRKDD